MKVPVIILLMFCLVSCRREGFQASVELNRNGPVSWSDQFECSCGGSGKNFPWFVDSASKSGAKTSADTVWVITDSGPCQRSTEPCRWCDLFVERMKNEK